LLLQREIKEIARATRRVENPQGAKPTDESVALEFGLRTRRLEPLVDGGTHALAANARALERGCHDRLDPPFDWLPLDPQTVHVSPTPGHWEMEQTGGVFVEQVIRPTGLIDPQVGQAASARRPSLE
jgi:hypothetical protein